MSKSVELEDTFSNIWCTHKIDFKQFSLQMSFIWSVLSQGFQKEGSCFLDSSILQKDLDNWIDWGFWNISTISVGNHFS